MARTAHDYDVSDTWRNDSHEPVSIEEAQLMAPVEDAWRTSIRALADVALEAANSAEERLGPDFANYASDYAVSAARYQAQQHGPHAVESVSSDYRARIVRDPLLPPPLDQAGVSNPGSRRPL